MGPGSGLMKKIKVKNLVTLSLRMAHLLSPWCHGAKKMEQLNGTSSLEQWEEQEEGLKGKQQSK